MQRNFGTPEYPTLTPARLGLLGSGESQTGLPPAPIPSGRQLTGLSSGDFSSLDGRPLGYDIHLGANASIVQQPDFFRPTGRKDGDLYAGLKGEDDCDDYQVVFVMDCPSEFYGGSKGAREGDGSTGVPYFHWGVANFLAQRNNTHKAFDGPERVSQAVKFLGVVQKAFPTELTLPHNRRNQAMENVQNVVEVGGQVIDCKHSNVMCSFACVSTVSSLQAILAVQSMAQCED
jgi:hypothetical protein